MIGLHVCPKRNHLGRLMSGSGRMDVYVVALSALKTTMLRLRCGLVPGECIMDSMPDENLTEY